MLGYDFKLIKLNNNLVKEQTEWQNHSMWASNLKLVFLRPTEVIPKNDYWVF